ncbi:MAG: Holliday junction resolvase RuvX [Nitrospirae bacterium]|nr:Holliday junction resolvase RuvX [Nitrospirota bacterium]
MRILSLDVGDKRIGVAISDELEIAAHSLTTIHRSDPDHVFASIKEIIEEYNVEEIVVGMPVMMNGTMGIQGEKVSSFVEELKKEVVVPVMFMDERLSTRYVEKVLIDADVSRKKRGKVIDKLAAVIILQDYLRIRGIGGSEKTFPDED